MIETEWGTSAHPLRPARVPRRAECPRKRPWNSAYSSWPSSAATTRPRSEVIHNSIEQTVACRAGRLFNTAWYAEHHFNNYSLLPSPLMMVAHWRARPRRIRLGTAVCILPLYHPQRFLAEVGFVDTVSNGRLDLGVGSGYQQFEFERFGINVADAPRSTTSSSTSCQRG